jgi:hypothetical protein
VRHAGQAFRLGRYPVHFHMNGELPESYVKGSAIHHTYNRALTMHGTNSTLVQRNVAFDSMGHQFFIEDGSEARPSSVHSAHDISMSAALASEHMPHGELCARAVPAML